jgi:hypothetical protein
MTYHYLRIWISALMERKWASALSMGQIARA